MGKLLLKKEWRTDDPAQIMMHATPDFSHLSVTDYDTVYEPAEDTFLLLDALEKEAESIKCIKPLMCIEVGCGSGVVSAFVASLLGPNTLYICTDINNDAALATHRTGLQNGVSLNTVRMDLVSCLMPRLNGSVDILICNPPYVVTSPNEVGSCGIEASWAGGDKGREVMDRLFPFVPQLLSKNGIFYLVIIKENERDEISLLLSKAGFQMSEVLSRRSGPEHLTVLKFTRTVDRTKLDSL